MELIQEIGGDQSYSYQSHPVFNGQTEVEWRGFTAAKRKGTKNGNVWFFAFMIVQRQGLQDFKRLKLKKLSMSSLYSLSF